MLDVAGSISASGTVRSDTGFEFPDGSVLTSAPNSGSQFLNIGPGAYAVHDSDRRLVQNFCDNVYAEGAGVLHAPIQLPNGARILSIKVLVRDEVDSNFTSRSLEKSTWQ